DKMASFNNDQLPNENPVNQISSTYYVVNINNVIDANILEHYLRTEFEYRNIHVDYEYAIYDCESNKMVYGNYISSTKNSEKFERNIKFPVYNEFTYYFGINFPRKTSYLIKGMRVWIMISVVLMIAILFFGYSIFVILKQRRLSEIQKDFINNMTHEFKTPISTIGISTEVISKPAILEDPDRLFNYVDIIQKQNKRLENQVEKVLQIAYVEKRKFNLNPEEIDLNELLNNIKSNLELNLNEINGKFIMDLKANNPIIKADKLHFTNVIYNLIDNAIKYGREKPEVKIETLSENNKLKISIIDNGLGIEKKYQKKIFSKFYRVPTGNIHNVKGFGLGLNYVKKIIKVHNWKINVISEINKGSRFEITIPINGK
ncbi:MAG: HAMP domain-containing histidine kinase, partial [Saprospiraceae bacterium]|nr:HAMP domain-containing histidine kinase [Saprospiraceae bacterium]